MPKLSDTGRNFLSLVMRSPDRGDGWRSVAPRLWTLVESFQHPELLEVDAENSRIRLSEKGLHVTAYLV